MELRFGSEPVAALVVQTLSLQNRRLRMPARIVVHDGPCLERMISGLSQRGHDVRGYSDPLAALSALEDARRVEVLLTRLHFGPGKSNGVALALMARLKRPGVKVDNPELTAGLGEVAEGPVDAASLTDLVDRLLGIKVRAGWLGGRLRRQHRQSHA
jgi:hypothetical protein